MLNQCMHSFVTNTQLINNKNIELDIDIIEKISYKCRNKPCYRYTCKDKPKQLPYCQSFEDVLRMKKAQNAYSNDNYRVHDTPYNSL